MNFASATASLKKVRGIILSELGYDIRKAGGVSSPLGSNCDVDAPRFDIQTTNNFYFIACTSPPPTSESPSGPWDRLRWGTGTPGSVMGYCATCTGFPLVPITEMIERIDIVFDEGTDVSPFFGVAILDNIDVNGTLVGHSQDED